MKFIVFAGLTAAVGLAALAPAEAASRHRRRAPVYRSAPVEYTPAAREAIYCRPACLQDTSPCDPAYFKVADGRCSGISIGR